MTIPPYAIAFFLTVGSAILSERLQLRAPIILASSSIAIIGYILLLTDYRPGVSYLGTIFAAAGIYPSVALHLAWPANNVSGQTKRAISTALQISIGNLGKFSQAVDYLQWFLSSKTAHDVVLTLV